MKPRPDSLGERKKTAQLLRTLLLGKIHFVSGKLYSKVQKLYHVLGIRYTGIKWNI